MKRTGICSSWLDGLDPLESTTTTPSLNPRILLRVFIYQHGLIKVLPHHHNSYSNRTWDWLSTIFVDLWRKESYKAEMVQLLQLFSSLVAEMKRMTLYKDFWLSHLQNGGVLSEEKGGGFYVAFSRDQPQKIYVQHKMKEQSKRLWNLLSERADVYVVVLQPKCHLMYFLPLRK